MAGLSKVGLLRLSDTPGGATGGGGKARIMDSAALQSSVQQLLSSRITARSRWIRCSNSSALARWRPARLPISPDTVVLASTTVSGLIGNRAGRHLASADELEHLIQRDLAVIRELNSCCTEDCNAAESMIRAFPPPPVAPPGVSLKRSRPTLDNPATNRLQWTYAVSTAWEQLISRVVNIVPSQPKVCP